jgi:aldehyde dehydrogenase (NAD+)
MSSTIHTHPLSVSPTEELRARARGALERCGVRPSDGAGRTGARSGPRAGPRSGPRTGARSPITGEELFDVPAAGGAEIEAAIAAAKAAFAVWRTVPAPARGALVKRFGALVAEHRAEIAELIAIEVGKIPSEAQGEVQEVIDICDFALGLSPPCGRGTPPWRWSAATASSGSPRRSRR